MKKATFTLALVMAAAAVLFAQESGPKDTTANARQLAAGHNAFGFTLLKSLHHEAAQKNIFLSPTSIEMALSMVYLGARGQTRAAMAKTLQLEGLEPGQIDRGSLELIERGSAAGLGAQLEIANSLWARQGVSLRPEFLETTKTYYKAEVTNLDFHNPRAAATINAWVSRSTHGKIASIVSSLPPSTVLCLINAVYFKGEWTNEFDRKLTKERKFTPAAGPPRMHPLMFRHDHFEYAETEDFQSVELGYGKQGRLSMYVFLPKKSLSDLLAKVDQPAWQEWMMQYNRREGTLLLPRFKMEYEEELSDVLIRLGMGPAFANADLSGIGDGLSISQVRHKSYVDVNEEGTEAAAVTGVMVGATAVRVPPPPPFYMEVNRPFLFFIYDHESLAVLFLGVVQNP